MRHLTLDDVLDRDAFVAQRPKLERELIQAKTLRRVHVGPAFTFLFENHATLLWQVQEMCRVENISRPAAIQDELDAYNPLLPSDSELSATLLVEYAGEAERKEMLVRLSGVDRHVRVEIEGEAPVPGVFETGREKEDGKISSVQFVRFPMSESQKRAFMDLGRSAAIVVDHPAYAARHELGAASRGALIDDLRAD
ncbi:MAG: DUF3501 family protein [Alphaproteobacteria bacterium]|nr:DUF3501 family protein [Alphaproteobacteria bacterium]MCB9794692.1 DUF3501 family protein [Alphaproteobacteria bacterium]